MSEPTQAALMDGVIRFDWNGDVVEVGKEYTTEEGGGRLVAVWVGGKHLHQYAWRKEGIEPNFRALHAAVARAIEASKATP